MNESDKPTGSQAENPAPTPSNPSPSVPATSGDPVHQEPSQPSPTSQGPPGEKPPSGEKPPERAAAAVEPAESQPAGEGSSKEGSPAEGRPPRKRRRRRRSRGDTPAGAEPAGGEAAPADATQAVAGRRDRRQGGRGSPGRSDSRHPHHQGGGRDTTHLATQAVRALSAMAQQLLRVEGVDPLAMPRYLELALRIPLDGGKDFRQAAGTAVEQILKRVREVREHEAALRPGAVFSFFTGSSHADGCRPTEPRQVFDGYGSTGKPTFTDFVTMAIERKNEGIDRLLAGEDVILTQVTMGRVLRTQQLAEFGGESPVYKILGQVNAGLFKVLGAAGKCAFSFQLLRGSTLEGRVRLRLHAVSAVDPMDLADPAIMQILTRFQRRLDAEALRLEGRMKNGGTDEEEFVLPLLNDLAKQMQNRTRNTGRRTQHGLERSEGGQRPTSRAYPDAAEASDDAILWDADQGTIVVLGAKSRVHVFSPDGKHVTSVGMQRSAIDRRRQLGRWRLAEPEERGEFRIQVRRSLADGAQPVTDADEAIPVAPAATEKPAVLPTTTPDEPEAPPSPPPMAQSSPAESPVDEPPAESAPESAAESPPESPPEGQS